MTISYAAFTTPSITRPSAGDGPRSDAGPGIRPGAARRQPHLDAVSADASPLSEGRRKWPSSRCQRRWRRTPRSGPPRPLTGCRVGRSRRPGGQFQIYGEFAGSLSKLPSCPAASPSFYTAGRFANQREGSAHGGGQTDRAAVALPGRGSGLLHRPYHHRAAGGHFHVQAVAVQQRHTQ